MDASLRALIVAYSFPPVGGAGVQRVSKLAKYLGAHGVTPAVLTVTNPSVPLRDESLAAELPRDLEVVRARTLEPSYAAKAAAWNASAEKPSSRVGPKAWTSRAISALSTTARAVLIPDAQMLWQPAAQLALAQRLRARRDDVILVSGPPFSQFLLAPLVRARGQVGVVLDYRDEWSTYRTSYEMTASRAARFAGDVLEPAMLRCAHYVTTATEEFREELLRTHRFLSRERVVTIPNGYDPDDFPSELPDPPDDRFVLTYAGTIFKLTSPRGLLGAIRRLHRAEPELARRLTVRFLGRVVDTERHLFDGTEALGVSMSGYVPHSEVVTSLSASHMTLCLLDDVPGAERIYPAKIFELMHLRRPVLTLAPEGALTRLARKHNLGEVVMPRDEEAIAAVLEARLRAPKQLRSSPVDIEQFDRRALAGRFAEVLRAAAGDARR